MSFGARLLSFVFGLLLGFLIVAAMGHASDVRVGHCFKLKPGVGKEFEQSVVVKLTGTKLVEDIYHKKAMTYVYKVQSFAAPQDEHQKSFIEFLLKKSKEGGLFIPLTPFPSVLVETHCE